MQCLSAKSLKNEECTNQAKVAKSHSPKKALIGQVFDNMKNKLAIIGRQVYLDAQTFGDTVRLRRYARVRSVKWPSEKHHSSDTVVCDFSEAAFGEVLASIRCPKTSPIRNIFWRSGRRSWTTIGRWNLSFLTVGSLNKLKSLQY